ncbi:MAG: hypothetical protein HKN30_08350 [Sulfitobacter sp.]|nr:hypothetical protein [Sulfitobacter sp.]
MIRLFAALTLFASPAMAVEVPSGQPVQLHEVLIDDLGEETWLRFRFIAPRISREADGIGYEAAADDMDHLCQSLVLTYMQDFELEGDMIVVSLSDRPVEFGQADPDVTQFFEAYRPVDNTCIWEGL